MRGRYLEYEMCLWSYMKARRRLEGILDKKEILFLSTQPNGIRYDKDKVSGGHASDPMARYMESLEELDEKQAKAVDVLEQRKRLLDAAESDLRASNATEDKIYVFRHLEGKRVNYIASRMHYSESQIYRILHVIEQTCEKMREEVW